MSRRVLPAVLFALANAACQSVPVTSLPALSRLDPLALEATSLRAAVTHHNALQLAAAGDNTLTLALRERGGPIILEEAFPLRVATLDRGREATVTAFQIAAEERTAFDEVMEDLRDRRQRGERRYSFAMTVDLKPCVTEGAPRSAERVDIDLKTNAGKQELPLARNLNLRQQGVPLPTCTPPQGL